MSSVYLSNESEVEDFLAHFGVKGMHWGVRKDTPTGATRATDHQAKKDATEFARAKMFYGQGAGTRRKLIKATVDARSSRNPAYKAAFNHHLANQDLAKRADQARSERGLLAAPSERAYGTINDSPEAIALSWGFSSTPVEVPGFKPSAILTINSTEVAADALASLEDLLYGTDGVGSTAKLPLPAEVIALFAPVTP